MYPNFYSYFPNFSHQELEERIYQYPYHIATNLTLDNILNSFNIKNGRKLFLKYLSLSTNSKKKILYEVLFEIIKDSRLCEVFKKIERHKFVNHKSYEFAYLNSHINYSYYTCLTHPGLLLLMIKDLNPHFNDEILEVGIGSGFHAACISEYLDNEVSIIGYEINKKYAQFGKDVLLDLGYKNISINIENAENIILNNILFDKIYSPVSFKKQPSFLKDKVKLNGALQYVRALSEEEFYSINSDAWLNTKFKDYNDYIFGENWLIYCYLCTEIKDDKTFQTHNIIKNVSFTPFISSSSTIQDNFNFVTFESIIKLLNI